MSKTGTSFYDKFIQGDTTSGTAKTKIDSVEVTHGFADSVELEPTSTRTSTGAQEPLSEVVEELSTDPDERTRTSLMVTAPAADKPEAYGNGKPRRRTIRGTIARS